jgi:uncharacterized protein YfaA (DUF2138 family)
MPARALGEAIKKAGVPVADHFFRSVDPVTLTRRQTAAVAMVLIIGVLIAIQAIWRPWHTGDRTTLALRYREAIFDIHRPDAIVDSAALSRLPRDIIRVPLLRSLLTEDFVDYYESAPTRLSAEGTLRRLAFEHDLDWRDEIVRRVFDEPSRVLLWRSPDGRLGYWAMAMRRNGLARLMQGIANVAANDTQLGQAGTLGGVPVYALKLSVGHTLLFAAKDERLIILSEPGMLLNAKGNLMNERAKELAKMLIDGGDEILRNTYHLDAIPTEASEHRLIVSARYLSFGYQTFFPGIEALRFNFSASGENNVNVAWSTFALIDPARLPQRRWDSAALWRALPANAAACASLPVDWNAAVAFLGKLDEQSASQALRDQLAGPVGACWYAKSTLVAPVFVARLRPEVEQNPARLGALKNALADAFTHAIGAYEAKESAGAGYHRLPVDMSEVTAGVTQWTRAVSARLGTASSAESPYATRLSTPRYFPVTLALAHGHVVFSPNALLVNNTLAVLDKRYPAIADTMAPQRISTTIAMITPLTAAALVEREAGRALPADQEVTFRNAASAHLLPKLRAVTNHAPIALSLPDALPSSASWVPVTWSFESGDDN